MIVQCQHNYFELLAKVKYVILDFKILLFQRDDKFIHYQACQ